MNSARREAPMRRTMSSGKVVYLARYTAPSGKRCYWKPDWNRKSSTFLLKRDAQRAIDEAYECTYGIGVDAATVGVFFNTWLERYPRSPRTNETNRRRVACTLDLDIEGRPFESWVISDLRRKQINLLVTRMLRDQGRSAGGASGILRSLSAMAEDAITEEVADGNPFKGVRIKANDPRASKAARRPQIWTFEQMHEFSDAALLPRLGADGESVKRDPKQALAEARAADLRRVMIRTIVDTGLRLGEVLALRRDDFDGERIRSRGNAHQGVITDGDTDTKKHERVVPCPPTLARLIEAQPQRIDSDLLFPTLHGKVWRERNFYRDVWNPTRVATAMDITPHECRHSYISHLRAAGVDDADLADVAGHTIQTMLNRYTHGLDRSHDQIRNVIG
jgi:integrase